MSDEHWSNNAIQYPRLIAELQLQGIPKRVIEDTAAEMDITTDEIHDLFDRAQDEWDRIKAGFIPPAAPEMFAFIESIARCVKCSESETGEASAEAVDDRIDWCRAFIKKAKGE